MNAVHSSVTGAAAAVLLSVIILGQMACRVSAPAETTAQLQALSALEGHSVYVAHCASCHGSAGLGNGPAAIALTVAPRDFFHERFRYVSTLNGVPSDEDLRNSIRYGRRYGDMPANPQLTDAEVDALASYIREIQRFGWVEELREEFADDDDTSPEEIEEISHIRVTPRDAIHVTRPDSAFQSNTETGRELYVANCAACHGLTGRGDGLAMPLDEQGNPIVVRDLTSGKFRGGTEVEETFKRIRCGVPGTPMSAAVALSEEEVWQLVYYVRFLAGQR